MIGLDQRQGRRQEQLHSGGPAVVLLVMVGEGDPALHHVNDIVPRSQQDGVRPVQPQRQRPLYPNLGRDDSLLELGAAGVKGAPATFLPLLAR